MEIGTPGAANVPCPEPVLDSDTGPTDSPIESDTDRLPLVAEAGPFQLAYALDQVVLDGSASIGNIDTYNWRQTDGPPVSFNTQAGALATFHVPAGVVNDEMTFELTVRTPGGRADRDTTTVYITPQPGGTITPDSLLDFEADDGGLVTLDSLWEWGEPVAPPGVAYSGRLAWATDLDSTYPPFADASLYFPSIDLTGETGSATVSFRMVQHVRDELDGTVFEVFDGANGWTMAPPAYPLYQENLNGDRLWPDVGYRQEFEHVAIPLDVYVGTVVHSRLRFVSNAVLTAAGATVDDLGLHRETSDPMAMACWASSRSTKPDRIPSWRTPMAMA